MTAFGCCIVFLVTCLAQQVEPNERFQLVETQAEKISSHGVNLDYVYPLTDKDVVVIEYDTLMDSGGPGWRFCFFDRATKQFVYRSEIYDSPYEWELYDIKTDSQVIILWRVENEYNYFLPLYVFHLKSGRFASVGEFAVSLYSDPIADFGGYPVEDIQVKGTDTLFTFRFAKKLWFYPFDQDSAFVADSAIYRLDLRNDSLHVAQYPENSKK